MCLPRQRQDFCLLHLPFPAVCTLLHLRLRYFAPTISLPCSDKDKIFAFSTDCAQNIVESYVPIIKKHKNDPYSPRQKEWQQIRRGR